VGLTAMTDDRATADRGDAETSERVLDADKAYRTARERIGEGARRPEQQELDLSGLGLTALPPEIARLTALQTLDLSGNQLSSLPPEIARLTALQTLYLSGNQLSSLPPEIAQLTALQSLYLGDNQLSSLPPEIAQLRSLEEAARADTDPITIGLWLDNNPLPKPYPKLIENGQPDATINVLAWLRGELDPDELPESPSQRNDDDADNDDADDDLAEALTQRPAAFRFGLRRGKIDALPERPKVSDIDVAEDLYSELVSKTRALAERLTRTNSDQRAQASVGRLIECLGARLEDVRPGILLSRSRSVEADRNAFSTAKARRELFPDAIAMMDDVLMSLEDLMAAFPAVREIEAEQLALAVQRDPQVIKTIQRETGAIKAAAAAAEAVTANAVNALKEHDADIAAARNNTIRARLLGDQLLVVRNFVGEAIRAVRAGGSAVAAAAGPGLRHAGSELKGLGGDSWEEIRRGLPKGIGAAARALPIVGLAGLLTAIAGPVGGLAALSGSFRPLAKALEKVTGGGKRGKTTSATRKKKRKPTKPKPSAST